MKLTCSKINYICATFLDWIVALFLTTFYMETNTAKADSLPSTATDVTTTKATMTSSSSSVQANTTFDTKDK